MIRMRPAALLLTATVPLVLAACGTVQQVAGNPPNADQVAGGQPSRASAEASDAAAVQVPTLADDGPGVCFDAIVDHLGKQAKVYEVDSNFSAGQEIDPDTVNPEDTPPAGDLTYCSVTYQNPDDPKKLQQTKLDIETGEFDAPRPVEISVTGDASQFDLNDYVIQLSKIKTAPLPKLMKQQQGALDDAYGKHAWSGVDLASPDTWSAQHRLRVDIKGRLASNDILDQGYMEVSISGKKVIQDSLTP